MNAEQLSSTTVLDVVNFLTELIKPSNIWPMYLLAIIMAFSIRYVNKNKTASSNDHNESI